MGKTGSSWSYKRKRGKFAPEAMTPQAQSTTINAETEVHLNTRDTMVSFLPKMWTALNQIKRQYNHSCRGKQTWVAVIL